MRVKRRRVVFIVLGVLLVFVIVAIAACEPLLRYGVKTKARERGIELSIGDVDFSWSRLRIEDLRFTLIGVKGLGGKVERLDVQLDGLSPQRLEASGVQLSITGSAASLVVQLSEWTKNYPTLPGIPAVAEKVAVQWRAAKDTEPWLAIVDGSVAPDEAGGSFSATGAEVYGVDVGQVGATWRGGGTEIALGFGSADLSQAAVTIQVRYGQAQPEAEINLKPTPLGKLAGPMGMSLKTKRIVASGKVRLVFASRTAAGPVNGSLDATFEGYRIPVPPALKGIVFGDTTTAQSKLSLSADRRKISFDDLKLKNGKLQLAGKGRIERREADSLITLDLRTALGCADLAAAAARAGVGGALGRLIGGSSALVKGTIGIRLKVVANSRDLSAAQVSPTIGVGCGLRLPASLPILSKLPKLPIPGLPEPEQPPGSTAQPADASAPASQTADASAPAEQPADGATP